MTEPRSNDEDRAEIERLREDNTLWAEARVAWQRERDAERARAHAWRKACYAAAAALAAERAKVAAVEALIGEQGKPETHTYQRANESGDWRRGARHTAILVRLALRAVGGSTEGDRS